MKIKMKSKKMRGVITAALLLLALVAPPAAYGQSSAYGQSDGFFNNAKGLGDNTSGTGSWFGFGEDFGGSFAWGDFENGDAPLGGGLLVLALSGVCYAGAKKLKSRK